MATAEAKSESLHDQTIIALQHAYSMELESVANYLADSVNLDGVRAEEIKKSLAADVEEELGHARQLARRIKQLGGWVPGPTDLSITHSHMDQSNRSTDVEHVIRAVIQDEQAAIQHYKQLIRDTDGEDYVTQDLCIKLLADEEEHLTQFEGFLKEYATPRRS
ncbi:MAG: ferritin-like domain-containing protein [Pirellulaceae bacterium]